MKLVIEDEAGTRSIVPFAGEPIVVGRALEGVTFRLSDRNVSRRHARFVAQSGAVFVEDLGSLTGTRVNGERISARRRLREGDLVQIGDYDLAVLGEVPAQAGGGAPPPLPSPGVDPNATTARLPPIPSPSPAPARATADRTAPARSTRALVVAGAVALALGLAAGIAVGVLTRPAPPALTRP